MGVLSIECYMLAQLTERGGTIFIAVELCSSRGEDHILKWHFSAQEALNLCPCSIASEKAVKGVGRVTEDSVGCHLYYFCMMLRELVAPAAEFWLFSSETRKHFVRRCVLQTTNKTVNGVLSRERAS